MNDDIIKQSEIENRIFNFRGEPVMVDKDLAELYQVETKVLNQAVKRNLDRFPGEFRFQLNLNKKNELVTNCDRFESLKHSSTNPYVFTEQGVSMLSAVLRSPIAIKVSIAIMNAFVQMRKQIAGNDLILYRLDKVEQKQLETDNKINKQLNLDLKKHDAQYPPIEVKLLKNAHDRFLIIDEKELYHIGASLKDLDKKPVVSEAEPWFAFSKMNTETLNLLMKLKNKEALRYGE